MLSVLDVSFRYSQQQQHVLSHLTFECDSSGIVALAGSSGVGKSTLIGLISGIFERDDMIVGDLQGHLSLDGILPSALRGPSVISWVPQKPVLLAHLTAMENVLLPLSISGVTQEDELFAGHLLEELGMSQYSSYHPRSLSGGMRARISLARALVSRPKYLFLDEPFTGLDLASRWRVYQLILKERQHANLSTFLTSHDIPEVMLICDRVVLLERNDIFSSVRINEIAKDRLGLSDPKRSLQESRERALDIESSFFSGIL